MKILHIIAMSPLSPNSGIPAVLRFLAQSQNRINGVESRVLSITGKVDEIESPFFDNLGNQSIEEFITHYGPDIAIIHCFFYAEYIRTVRVLLKHKIPFCNEPHGSFGKNAMKKSALKKRIANATVFSQQIKKATSYIFTNNTEKEDSIYHSEHDIVIPNGVQPEIVINAAPKKSDSYSAPIFYYLGRYDIHHKGMDYLFDALDILDKQEKRYTIRFFGMGDEKQEEYVRERIKRFHNLNVENCGTIYGEQKKTELENCNILLLTSRYEGSPMTILDGLSYGNPCIVTPGTNVSDEIETNGLGWKTELDSDKIAETIIHAYIDYSKSGASYYTKCKQYVLDRYTWDRIAEESIEKLNNLSR